MPQANSHSTWALASQGGDLRQIANCQQRYATLDIGAQLAGRRIARRPHVLL